MLNGNEIDLLRQEAGEAKEKSYAKFSKFRVGAALLTGDGRIFTAGNIEISSYSLTLCAERVAIFKAFSEGVRNFKAIAISTDMEEFCPPCGSCLQVLHELAGRELILVLFNSKGLKKEYLLKEMLPVAFDENNLNAAETKNA